MSSRHIEVHVSEVTRSTLRGDLGDRLGKGPPRDQLLRTAERISLAVFVLLVVASAVGLLVPGFYRDNLWVTSQLRGSDLVRLVVVAPLFAVTLLALSRRRVVARLVWLGVLWLTVYDYSFYLFGTAFNELFLVYAALVALSLIGLVYGVAGIDAEALARRLGAWRVTVPVAGYLLFIAVFLGGLWVSQVVDFVVTGSLPRSLVDSGSHTDIVFALDLSLLVPALVVSSIWLLRRNAWGFVLASLMMVKAVLYPLALVGMSVFYLRASGEWDPFGWFWLGFALTSMFFAWLLFRRAATEGGGTG